LMLEEELAAEQREYMEAIRAGSDILLETINNVLDFSKIAAGKTELEKIDFQIQAVAESVLDLLAGIAQRKRIELALLVDENVPTAVSGDPGRLRQVLVNLVSNAVKFTSTGEVVVKVWAEAETATSASLRFEVMDTGIGLSETERKRLFQPFQQADSSTTRKFGGSGLGLAIAARLVELMGGAIGVDSEQGRGSTFWFTVRFEKASTEAIEEIAHELAGLRVLIVDDNATNRQIVRRLLESAGIRVDSVANGAGALAMLRSKAAEEAYAVALVDLKMPEMDGLELALKIREEPALADIRVVMMSSAGDRRDFGSRTAALDEWLTKPVTRTQLMRALTSLPIRNRQPNGSSVVEANGQQPGVQSLAKPTDPSNTDGPGAGSESLASRTKGRILVVEDNQINQRVILTQLKKLGYQGEGAGDGREALTMLARFAYDAVLMDCQMPEMDGYEATRQLRKLETDGRHRIIIAVTAFGLSGDREKCLEAGMDDYLAKPVRMEQLEETLNRWIEAKGKINLSAVNC